MKDTDEGKMGTEREGRLLCRMAVPFAFSMLVQALYNIVDSAFVGQVSEDALSAVSVVFPFQSLFAALNVGISVGMSQLISMNMGKGDQNRAKKAAGQGLFLALCCTAFFIVFGIFFSDDFFRISGITGPIKDMGMDYLRIITIFSLGVFTGFVTERMLMSTGHTGCTVACQITGAVLNIILDPILIFGCGPIPAMGVRGAAIATVFAQHASMVLAVVLHLRKNKVLRFSPKDIKPQGKILKSICGIGASATVKQGAAAVISMFVNGILVRISPVSTAVYGAFNKLYVLFLTPSWAIQDVLVILSAYNLGIGNRHRIMRLFRLSLVSGLILTLLGCAVTIFFPCPLLKIFGAKEDMLSVGKTALPILACFLPFQTAASVISALLQGVGEGGSALLAGIAERFIFPLIFLYLSSLFKSLNLVWWSFTASEALGLVVSALFMLHIYKKKIAKLPL